eukprot:6188782-Pleurochrysis_carterae.AAC.2
MSQPAGMSSGCVSPAHHSSGRRPRCWRGSRQLGGACLAARLRWGGAQYTSATASALRPQIVLIKRHTSAS